jgi:hypothetical protein
MDDIDNIWNWKYNWTQFEEYKFSQGVLADWSTDLLRIMFNSETIENPVIEQQINLN